MNHFLRIYVPLTVIVVMSWTCFLIDHRSVPARTSMNAALVLTVITFITSIQQTLPRTSDIRLLDIHMMVSFFYVFAGLVEYSFALSMEIRLRMQQRKELDEEIKVCLLPGELEKCINCLNNLTGKAMKSIFKLLILSSH